MMAELRILRLYNRSHANCTIRDFNVQTLQPGVFGK
jgi:hypothetical protein